MPSNPIQTPDEHIVFRVAGVALPGLATVSGCVDQSKLDVRAGTATKGATIVYQGGDPQEFTVELQFFEDGEIDEWDNGEGHRILAEAPTGKNAKAFAVDHPECQRTRITAAVKKSISQLIPVGDGSYKVQIKLTPSELPKPATGTPKGSATTWANHRATSAESKADAAMAELEEQLKKAKAA